MRNIISLDISVANVVNYALQQNKIPFIQSFKIQNTTDVTYENAEIKITSSPEIILPFTKHIDYIPANTSLAVKDISPLLNTEYLSSLTERVVGVLNLSITADNAEIYSEQRPLTALAFDQWQGSEYFPELIAAYITPNHPEITKIKARASQLLEKWTGSPSFTSYQTQDPNRVLTQAAAFYGAVQERNLVYSVSPAGLHEAGQRVRLCEDVMQQKMCNCLEATLLFAACLESAGLNPLLIMEKGHVFPGVWLEDRTFPEAVQYDISAVTKRLAKGINEIAVFESTLALAGINTTDFDIAKEQAEKRLISSAEFEYTVDVKKARLCGISPLPQRIATDTGWYIERPNLCESEITVAPEEIKKQKITQEDTAQAKSSTSPKKLQWERKLLDLGLRNALINMRLSKTTVPILTSSLDELENALFDGGDFSIQPRPENWHIPQSDISFENIHDLGNSGELIKTEFKSNRLRSSLSETELTKAIKELYRASRTALEENGANTLYLVLGILRWFETSKSTKARYAPLMMIPIEMLRKGAGQGYIIRLRDDEPHVNITMLEKLKQDFGIEVNGLDPLPMDEHGIDVRKVLTILRNAVMEQSGWDVLESAYLGIYSFSQFVMWNDIKNRSDDLEKNKIVKSLIDGKLSWSATDMEIGERVSESNVFLPLPADASQLFAIEAAVSGESFVLHGPPGTGKSQTITALIANALAQGKTVLFVAEKMAALQVVRKRLSAIGIGPFCLELHSNKSKKKDVLEQLRIVSEITKHVTSEDFQAKAEKIADTRNELDEYSSYLHKKHKCGKTLYELINEYEAVKSAPDSVKFSSDFILSVTAEDTDTHSTVLERLVAAAKVVGHPCENPLKAIGLTQYSRQLKATFTEKISAYKKALMDFHACCEDLCKVTNILIPEKYSETECVVKTVQELTKWFDLPRSWAVSANIKRLLCDTRETAKLYIQVNDMKQQLLANWTEDVFLQDGKALLCEFNEANAEWLIPKFMSLRKLSKKVSAYMKKPIAKELLGAQFTILANYQAQKKEADTLFAQCGMQLDDLYQGANTDWKNILAKIDVAEASAATLEELHHSDNVRIEYAAVKQLQSVLEAAKLSVDEFCSKKEDLYETLCIQQAESDCWYSDQIKMCDTVLLNADALKDHITWNAMATDAKREGLDGVIDAYCSGLEHENVIPAYKKALISGLINEIIDSEPALTAFSGSVFNEKIEQFKRMDAELTALTKKEIFCRLAAKIPNFAKEASQSSELGILQKAIRSGGRGISIRKLFSQIPNLLPLLCPCMLMSPISAAQYLDPKREPFDIVVFDEASQLPTCKAVGVLARGRDAVIVGDPKQMPPTSFFATNTVDEEDFEAEDLESILDDCLALSMPQTHLLWHYRSRHESLIAFSNSQFYDNKLYTFPSINDRESKVRLVPVNGIFDRGKTRQNVAEAEAIIEDLKKRCHDPERSKMSVGVVTFNISQQNLIDDLLTEACRNDRDLEKWVYESEEPLFIKNLENVQGDERDVILFSVGYGPDKDGKVYMNFGPLNRDGGWRRLNVAISRARYEMTVYSALLPEHIDLSRSNAQGVAALKEFLEYAAGKALSVNNFSLCDKNILNKGIADSICEVLHQHGYKTEKFVGKSEYRIDIGVIDNDNPEKYLLGILLDGKGYSTAKTTRDREIAQISVLNGLGWNILRVWSVDWWENPKKETERLINAIDAIKNGSFETDCNADALFNEDDITLKKLGTSKTAKIPQYEAAVLKEKIITPEEFMLPKYDKEIKSKISAVLKKEAPICEDLLIRRVVQSFGITRAGTKMHGKIVNLINELDVRFTLYDFEKIYWHESTEPESYCIFRTSGTEENRRDAEFVPVQEAANAVCRVLSEQVSLAQEDLIRESAKIMGYTRSGSVLTALFANAIEFAYQAGKITKGANEHWILN